METLIQILIAFFLLIFGVQTGPPGPPPPPIVDVDPAGSRILSVVESGEVLILESNPPQVQVTVRGYHPDGCGFPVQIDQRREGNTITVDVYRIVPADVMCPMNIPPFETTFTLDGPFEVGNTYSIIVNGFAFEAAL